MKSPEAVPAIPDAFPPRHTRVAGNLSRWLIPCLLVAVTLLAYRNSFDGAFLLDDNRLIVENPRIRQFWPPWLALSDTNRPISRLTLAFNYALGGTSPWGYHAFNLTVHALAGLLLFGVVRCTLESGTLRTRYLAATPWLAGAAAAIWLVHPLETESVTYVIQRDEALMGMLFLLTLYASIRAHRSSRSFRWGLIAVVACALGMATKEVMVSAPIMVMLYDRAFVFASFKDAFTRRGGFYASLVATWTIVGALFLAAASTQSLVGLAGDTDRFTAWQYAITQPGVIVHYLLLSLWPHPLVFDYRWPIATSPMSVAPHAALLLALAGGSLLAFRRWPGWTFLAAWFFLVLAPTSSILPIADVAFEHRMYLPLAAVVVALVLGVHELCAWLFRLVVMPKNVGAGLETVLLVAVVVALAVTTNERNDDYRSAIAMWSDVVAKRPDNPRAHNNLGAILTEQGRPGEATAQFVEAVRLDPAYADAHYNLGIALEREGRTSEAIAQFSEAIRLRPGHAGSHLNLGLALAKQGKASEARAHYVQALALKPDEAVAHNSLGNALASEGKVDAAIAQYNEALRLDPKYGEAENNLGAALHREGKVEEAIAHFKRAIELDPNYAVAYNNLGAALGSEGKLTEAARHFATAVRLKPDFAEARDNLRKAEASLPKGLAAP